ncbi:MAG TPA: NAD-dependent epimerase/dehydratase [Planctomycetaceae bacterium]|nr:NAD-dependent epimerase/dehydratase [Planctomycetaceae bacterium]
MNTSRRFRLTRAMAMRMAADAAMINLALIAALALRFLVAFAMHESPRGFDYEQEFWSYVSAYLWNAGLLTFVCLVVFVRSGFYTYGRAYQGRYKALVIVQAVCLAYLVFGVLTYFLADRLPLVEIPRGALILTWLINLGLTLTSRTWTFLWERVIRPERERTLRGKDGVPRSVLVIGGAGYIGSALLPKLLRRGYRVRVLDMFLYGTEPIRSVADHPRLELVKGDFRHVDKVVEVMHGMDAVVHLGAIVGDPACELDHQVTIDVNLSATQMIAQVAKASGVSRFIFASTCSVYGACDELLDERSEVKPISLYGKTKLAAERGLRSMADAGFAPTIVRFATIYGLSGRTRFDLVVNLLAAKAKTEGKITVFGGSQWRPFVHVDDAALGVFQLLEAPLSLVGNETFNVGSNEQNYTIEQIGRMVYDEVVGAELILDENSPDKRNYRVSFDKLRNTIGFEPEWTVEEGIRQVVDAVVNGSVEDYREARYSNVRHLAETGAIQNISTEDDWSRQLTAPEPEPQFAT